MQKLLISLGLDMKEWKLGLSKARKEFGVLTAGVKKGINRAIKGGMAVAGGGAALFGMGQLIADHSRRFEKLRKVTGATSSEMKSLKEDVYGLNKELGLRSVKDTVEKMTLVARLSRKTGDELRRLTYQTALLGKEYGNEEEQLTAQLALTRAFKTSIRQAGDVMAYLNRQGGDLKGELLESVKEYSVQFAEAGFTIDQTVAILKSGLGKGWNVDKAADAFKEGRLRLMGGDKSTVDALKMLGLGDLDAQLKKGEIAVPQAMSRIQAALSKLNKTERFRIAKDIFGTQYEDIGSEAMSAMLEGMNVKLKTSGAIDLLTNDLHGRFSYKWDKAVSDSTNAFSRMLDSLKPHVLPLVEWFGKAAEKVSLFSRKYQYITKTVGASFGIVAGLTVLLGGLNIIVGLLNIGLAILTSPISLVVAGAIALGAALVYLEKKTGSLSAAWSYLKTKGGEIWEQIKLLSTEIFELLPNMEELAKSLDFNAVAKTFSNVFNFFIITPVKAGLSMFKGLLKIVRSVINIFTDGFNQKNIALMFDGISDAFIKPIKMFFDTDLINWVRNSALGKLMGWEAEEEPPKNSPKEIRENRTGSPYGYKTTAGRYSATYQNPNGQKNQNPGKQTTIYIGNYHSNSNNASADWETMGMIVG